MNIKITVDNNPQSILLSQQLRREIFGEEQGISADLDIDGLDNNSFHALAYDKCLAIGIARLALHKNNRAHLARVAIKKEHRGLGIATQLIKSLLVKAKELNIIEVELHAHDHLQKYYESFGFTDTGQTEQVGDHPLIKMCLRN
ncbi:MAG: GNAT family N-acetyltransferase [Colwellia sp.]|nr:GNAT family N-acetyltransferase [Colwellia sp.]